MPERVITLLMTLDIAPRYLNLMIDFSHGKCINGVQCHSKLPLFENGSSSSLYQSPCDIICNQSRSNKGMRKSNDEKGILFFQL